MASTGSDNAWTTTSAETGLPNARCLGARSSHHRPAWGSTFDGDRNQARFRRKDECRFREVELARDLLHLGAFQTAGVGQDG
ncbi:MAG: hypothetical protein M2R45_05178 [Verrucomicrobia subdivision 3 bacterium]|nr:hypothetical protein [Limisphaerales bacterium]MCS1416298.1 hypothetical protein [Limisphaerales bacterium]